MDPGDEAQPDREQLESRVEELEATVSKMLPDRRGVVKGLGAAIGGGLLGASATGGASGQSGPAGRQGTPENPNDMFAWDLDVANEVVTDLDLGDNELRSRSVKTESIDNIEFWQGNRDLQTLLDSLSPRTLVVGDKTTEQTINSRITISVQGTTLSRFNLKLADGSDDGMLRCTADDATIKNSRLDHNKANNTGEVNPGYSTIAVNDCQGVTVENNKLIDPLRHGVAIEDIDGAVGDVTVESNTITNPVRDGISSSSEQGIAGNVSDVTYRDNDISGSDNRGGMEVNEGVVGATIEDNSVTAGTSVPTYGVNFQDHNVDIEVSDIEVKNNELRDADIGVDFQNVADASDIDIKNNEMRDVIIGWRVQSGTSSIENITIESNDITDASGAPFEAEGTVSDIDIIDNRYIRCTKTARLGRNGNYADVTIQGNRFIDCADGGRDALVFHNVDDISISDNLVRDATDDGIKVLCDDGATHSRIRVRDNDSLDNGGDGIAIVESSGTLDVVIITDNVAQGNSGSNLNDGSTGTTKEVSANLV